MPVGRLCLLSLLWLSTVMASVFTVAAEDQKKNPKRDKLEYGIKSQGFTDALSRCRPASTCAPCNKYDGDEKDRESQLCKTCQREVKRLATHSQKFIDTMSDDKFKLAAIDVISGSANWDGYDLSSYFDAFEHWMRLDSSCDKTICFCCELTNVFLRQLQNCAPRDDTHLLPGLGLLHPGVTKFWLTEPHPQWLCSELLASCPRPEGKVPELLQGPSKYKVSGCKSIYASMKALNETNAVTLKTIEMGLTGVRAEDDELENGEQRMLVAPMEDVRVGNDLKPSSIQQAAMSRRGNMFVDDQSCSGGSCFIVTCGSFSNYLRIKHRDPRVNEDVELGAPSSKIELVPPSNVELFDQWTLKDMPGKEGKKCYTEPPASDSDDDEKPKLVQSSTMDIFITAENSHGEMMWVNQIGSEDAVEASAIETDSKHVSVVHGQFTTDVRFYVYSSAQQHPDQKVLRQSQKTHTPHVVQRSQLSMGQGWQDAFIAWYSSRGQFMRAAMLSTQHPDDDVLPAVANKQSVEAKQISIDKQSCEVYVAGKFKGGMTARAANDRGLVGREESVPSSKDRDGKSKYDSFDGYVCKFTQRGDLVWCTSVGGVLNDEVTAVTVFVGGDTYAPEFIDPPAVVVAGNFEGELFWRLFAKGGHGHRQLNAAAGPGLGGKSDIFVGALSAEGMVIWLKRMGGPGLDKVQFVLGISGTSDFFVSGSFQGSAEFGLLDNSVAHEHGDMYMSWGKDVVNRLTKPHFCFQKMVESTMKNPDYPKNSTPVPRYPTLKARVDKDQDFCSRADLSRDHKKAKCLELEPKVAKGECCAILREDNPAITCDHQVFERSALHATEVLTGATKADRAVQRTSAGCFVSKEDMMEGGYVCNSDSIDFLGDSDGFIAKFHINGDMQYVRAFGGERDDVVKSMSSKGDVLLVSGDFEKYMLFEGSPKQMASLATGGLGILGVLYNKWVTVNEGFGSETFWSNLVEGKTSPETTFIELETTAPKPNPWTDLNAHLYPTGELPSSVKDSSAALIGLIRILQLQVFADLLTIQQLGDDSAAGKLQGESSATASIVKSIVKPYVSYVCLVTTLELESVDVEPADPVDNVIGTFLKTSVALEGYFKLAERRVLAEMATFWIKAIFSGKTSGDRADSDGYAMKWKSQLTALLLHPTSGVPEMYGAVNKVMDGLSLEAKQNTVDGNLMKMAASNGCRDIFMAEYSIRTGDLLTADVIGGPKDDFCKSINVATKSISKFRPGDRYGQIYTDGRPGSQMRWNSRGKPAEIQALLFKSETDPVFYFTDKDAENKNLEVCLKLKPPTKAQMAGAGLATTVQVKKKIDEFCNTAHGHGKATTVEGGQPAIKAMNGASYGITVEGVKDPDFYNAGFDTKIWQTCRVKSMDDVSDTVLIHKCTYEPELPPKWRGNGQSDKEEDRPSMGKTPTGERMVISIKNPRVNNCQPADPADVIFRWRGTLKWKRERKSVVPSTCPRKKAVATEMHSEDLCAKMGVFNGVPNCEACMGDNGDGSFKTSFWKRWKPIGGGPTHCSWNPGSAQKIEGSAGCHQVDVDKPRLGWVNEKSKCKSFSSKTGRTKEATSESSQSEVGQLG